MSERNRNRGRGLSLWRERTSIVISIALVLMVFGLLVFLGYHSYRVAHDMQERITYKVDLQDDVSDSLAVVLKSEIEQSEYVKHVEYISKDDAAELFAQELGDDFVGFIGYNPLYPSLMVNFKSSVMPDRDQHVLQAFTEQMARKEGVTGVTYQQNVVDSLYNVFYQSFWFLVVFVGLLLFVSVVLINNTIKLSLYTHRQSIATMRMVGAKTSFIARPFLWRSVLYGFVGAVCALLLLGVMVVVYERQYHLGLLQSEHYLPYAALAVCIVLAGIIVSWFATAMAVRRNVRHAVL